MSNLCGWGISQEEEIVKNENNSIAMRRSLFSDIQKETLIIGRDKSSIDNLEQLATWYINESTWLDWVLDRLGYPQFEELVQSTAGI